MRVEGLGVVVLVLAAVVAGQRVQPRAPKRAKRAYKKKESKESKESKEIKEIKEIKESEWVILKWVGESKSEL